VSPLTIEAYAMFDDDEGLLYETLADTSEESANSIDDQRMSGDEGRATMHRLATGKCRVRCVRIEVMGYAEFQVETQP